MNRNTTDPKAQVEEQIVAGLLAMCNGDGAPELASAYLGELDSATFDDEDCARVLTELQTCAPLSRNQQSRLGSRLGTTLDRFADGDWEAAGIADLIKRFNRLVGEARKPKPIRRLTVKLDGEDMARLYPDPENVLWWPTRNATYDFHSTTGLWSEDHQAARTRAKLWDAADGVLVPAPKAKEPDRKLPVRLDGTTVGAGVLGVQLKRQHANPPWDADPHLCGTPTGVFDLTTGGARPGKRSEYVQAKLGVTPVEGPHPVFDAFMEFAFPDAAERDYVLVMLAAMIGAVRIDRVFYLQGSGGSGKTTLVHLLKLIAGTYAGAFPRNTIARGKGEYAPSHRAWMIPLRHVRFAVVPETRRGQRIDGAQLNDWTGGGWFTADSKGGAEESWTSFIKVIMYGNEKPVFDVNSGIERRLVRVVMDQVPDEADEDLPDKLGDEAQHIAFTLASIYRARLDGPAFLPPAPRRFDDATRALLAESDHRQRFWDEHISFTGKWDDCVTSADLQRSLAEWWEQEGFARNAPQAGRWLAQKFSDTSPAVEKDLPRIDGKRTRIWRRITLR